MRKSTNTSLHENFPDGTDFKNGRASHCQKDIKLQDLSTKHYHPLPLSRKRASKKDN